LVTREEELSAVPRLCSVWTVVGQKPGLPKNERGRIVEKKKSKRQTLVSALRKRKREAVKEGDSPL